MVFSAVPSATIGLASGFLGGIIEAITPSREKSPELCALMTLTGKVYQLASGSFLLHAALKTGGYAMSPVLTMTSPLLLPVITKSLVLLANATSIRPAQNAAKFVDDHIGHMGQVQALVSSAALLAMGAPLFGVAGLALVSSAAFCVRNVVLMGGVKRMFHPGSGFLGKAKEEEPELNPEEERLKALVHETKLMKVVPLHENHVDEYDVVVNPEHMEIEAFLNRDIPRPPRGVRLERLLTLFDKINFTRSDKEGYRNPALLRNDGGYATAGGIREGLSDFIRRIREKEAFYGTPPAGSKELNQWYRKLEKLMKHITHMLDKEDDPYARAGRLIELGVAGTHCGGRYMGEAMEVYDGLKDQEGDASFEVQTVRGRVCKRLYRERDFLFRAMVKQRPEEVYGFDETHHFMGYMKLIGNDLGLHGSIGADYSDPFGASLSEAERERIRQSLLQTFYNKYSPNAIADVILDAINGTHGEKPSIDKEHVIDWFRDHVPERFLEEDNLARIKADYENDRPVMTERERSRRIAELKAQIPTCEEEYSDLESEFERLKEEHRVLLDKMDGLQALVEKLTSSSPSMRRWSGPSGEDVARRDLLIQIGDMETQIGFVHRGKVAAMQDKQKKWNVIVIMRGELQELERPAALSTKEAKKIATREFLVEQVLDPGTGQIKKQAVLRMLQNMGILTQ